MSDPIPVTVHGGPGGIYVNREALLHLAGQFAAAGPVVSEALRIARHEQDATGISPFGDYGPTGLLDVSGLLRVHAALTDARRLLVTATDEVEGLATRLRAAADGYPWGTSPLQSVVFDRVEGLLGGVTWLASGPMRLVGRHPRTSGGPDDVAGVDTRTVDLMTGLLELPSLSRLIVGDTPDRSGFAVATGRAEVAPPRGLGDVIAGLGDVDRGGEPGGIDVRVLTDAHGRRRAVVDITGTRSWRYGGVNPADLRTNAGALTGQEGAYSQGVLRALRQAGVKPNEPVMLVGHSQGGMVAVLAATHAARSGEFAVTHVVTAGSPIGLTVHNLPSSVRVLALENTHDLVPRLDGLPNPDRANVTTAAGPVGDGTVTGSHDVAASYRPLADATAATTGRSVRDYLTSAEGFFTADTAEQQTFRIERR